MKLIQVDPEIRDGAILLTLMFCLALGLVVSLLVFCLAAEVVGT